MVTLPKFNSEFSPEKLPKPNRKKTSSKHNFSGANSLLNFGGVGFRDSGLMVRVEGLMVRRMGPYKTSFLYNRVITALPWLMGGRVDLLVVHPAFDILRCELPPRIPVKSKGKNGDPRAKQKSFMSSWWRKRHSGCQRHPNGKKNKHQVKVVSGCFSWRETERGGRITAWHDSLNPRHPNTSWGLVF